MLWAYAKCFCAVPISLFRIYNGKTVCWTSARYQFYPLTLWLLAPDLLSAASAINDALVACGADILQTWLRLCGCCWPVKQLLDKLHSVQNAAAWLIFTVTAHHQDHVQPLLRSLQLHVPVFRLALLVYRCLHSLHLCTRHPGMRSPTYLWPHCPSATALFDYVCHHGSMHPACYHRRPCLPGSCCVCLEQSVRVSSHVTIAACLTQ